MKYKDPKQGEAFRQDKASKITTKETQINFVCPSCNAYISTRIWLPFSGDNVEFVGQKD